MKRRTAPSVASSMVLLAATDISLRIFGYRRVMRIARRISNGVTRVPDDALISQTMQRILLATSLYPGRSECLEQAVVAYVLLRRRGIDVKLRIGVQPYPFSAHAWLELNGEPLTESPEVTTRFALLPDVAL